MRLHSLIERYRFVLLGVALLHFVVLHYFWIGIISWDGYGHRLPPIVELVQHGSYNLEKYDNWALLGFHPFVELVNAPFLALFGMDGLYFACAAFMPLAMTAVHAFVKEASGDARAALYATAAYLLVPLVNSQLFSGYVDWSIPGLVSFYLWSLLRAAKEPSKLRIGLVLLSSYLFTMARQQAPYLAVFFFAIVMALRFVVLENRRPKLTSWKTPALIGLVVLVGMVPEATIQIRNYLEHGSPIYPYRFELLGIKLGDGVSFKDLSFYAGVKEFTPAGLAKVFIAAWIYPAMIPYCFFDSRNMGAGLFMVLAIVTLPFSMRRANLTTKVLLGAFVFTAFGGRDFFLPRWSYTLVLVSTICTGLALAELLDRPKWRWLYFVVLGVAGLHVFRPEWDIWRIDARDAYPRLNASQSKAFIPGVFDLILYPDVGAKLVIVHWPANGFGLPLYGRKLTNTLLGNIPPAKLGDHCEGVSAFRAKDPDLVLVDVEDLTKDCPRTCAISGPTPGMCLGWKLTP